MQNKSKYFPLSTIFILVIVMGLTGCWVIPIHPYNKHSPEKLFGLTEIWNLAGVYMGPDSFNPMMVAGEGKVIFSGDMAAIVSKIYCLDGQNGHVLWEKSYPWPATAIFAASDVIYVGNGGVPQVTKYDLSTGNVLWSQVLDGRGLTNLYIIGDEVQISTDPFIHTILDKVTGKILQSTQDWIGGKDIYLITPEVTFIRSIKAIKTSTGELIWSHYDLDNELTLAPIFLDNMILLRTNRTMGSIYSLDRTSGAILWKSEENIVSSIAYSSNNSKIYALTIKGQLLSIDRDNGKYIVLAEFSSTPFIVSGEGQVGGYEVAFDDGNQMLYIYLGDSRQLFAFGVN
jgi:outer membrane protein assembly factor BamB